MNNTFRIRADFSVGTLIFLMALKFMGYIDWSWFWVMAPLWWFLTELLFKFWAAYHFVDANNMKTKQEKQHDRT